ncbi:hypothetical protein ACFL2S_00890 [Thermodesulfobacteriota bacterium]
MSENRGQIVSTAHSAKRRWKSRLSDYHAMRYALCPMPYTI